MKLISYKVWGNPKSTWLDKIVSIFSLGKYSHSEIAFENGECFSISPRENIGRIKKINYTEKEWNILDLNVSAETEEDVYKCCQIVSKANIEYDFLGAFTSPLSLCIQRKEKIFCSEICADIFTLKGIFKLERGCRFTPSKLQKTIERKTKCHHTAESTTVN